MYCLHSVLSVMFCAMPSQFIESGQVLNYRAKEDVMADSSECPGDNFEKGNTLETVTTRKRNIYMRIISAMPLFSPLAIGRKHGTSCYTSLFLVRVNERCARSAFV